MNYTTGKHVGSTGDVPDCFMIPHRLPEFYSMGTRTQTSAEGRMMYEFHGDLITMPTRSCKRCFSTMHVNNTFVTQLRHLPFGGSLTFVSFTRKQYRCPKCGKTVMEEVPFRAEHHRITKSLEAYIEDLLAQGYTNKEITVMTGVDQGAVKAIDLERLRREYTENVEGEGEDGTELLALKKPAQYSQFLIIDEFKLHNHHRYATHIIDAETGHILWIDHGKSKRVIYNFIEHVGEEWMKHVKAVACDMNSDFQEAFEERCKWIQIVFDHFHIVKNFNDKVISAVRKDEQKRLAESGDKEGAAALKKTKYILTSKRETLRKKDQEAASGKVISRGNGLFHQPEVKRHGGYEDKYGELLQNNKMLFTLDLVKDQLEAAYAAASKQAMAEIIDDVINVCRATENAHFCWFARLLESHYDGVIAHAVFQISTGKIEGINNKIKTLRRQGYGYPDDEYFFLKVIDSSYRPYVRNLKSHKVSH